MISRTHLKMKVWERGAGPTLACGTGTCALVVAAILNDLVDRCDVVRWRPLIADVGLDSTAFYSQPVPSYGACNGTPVLRFFALQVVDLPGGPLTINWDEATNKVFMTGAAQKVFDGVLTL